MNNSQETLLFVIGFLLVTGFGAWFVWRLFLLMVHQVVSVVRRAGRD